jgi:riboflavin kinase/FMN adenylyltransferase
MNIGTNPTISGSHQSLEVHIFNFDASIYDEEIRIQFSDRIRSEIKFESLEALQEQLQEDKNLVQSIFLK